MRELHGALEEDHEPGQYEIRLRGHLEHRWAGHFEGMSFTHASDGTTLLTGRVVDQAALHGLLRTVRDLGLPLVSVTQIDPTATNRPAATMDTDHQRSTQEASS